MRKIDIDPVKVILSVSVIFSVLLGGGYAAVGDLLATVTLPGGGSCSVAGTFDGTYYITLKTSSCSGTVIGIYTPPPGNGAATLESSKSIVDASGASVTMSALAWDPGREKLWGANAGRIYLIDLGDKTVDGSVVATLEFTVGVGGISLIDGLAYDASDDTLYYSPDINLNVYQFSTTGTLLNTIAPKNAAGTADGYVSGVVVGSGSTLYIGRNGKAEIRRVDKTTGTFVSTFATTAGRVEDLTCDPVTYSPTEAILSKDAYSGLYEAFEVETGTCPLTEDLPPDDPDPPVEEIPEFPTTAIPAVIAIGGYMALRSRRKA